MTVGDGFYGWDVIVLHYMVLVLASMENAESPEIASYNPGFVGGYCNETRNPPMRKLQV